MPQVSEFIKNDFFPLLINQKALQKSSMRLVLAGNNLITKRACHTCRFFFFFSLPCLNHHILKFTNRNFQFENVSSMLLPIVFTMSLISYNETHSESRTVAQNLILKYDSKNLLVRLSFLFNSSTTCWTVHRLIL